MFIYVTTTGVYQFYIASITCYHKFTGLKERKFIILQFCKYDMGIIGLSTISAGLHPMSLDFFFFFTACGDKFQTCSFHFRRLTSCYCPEVFCVQPNGRWKIQLKIILQSLSQYIGLDFCKPYVRNFQSNGVK